MAVKITKRVVDGAAVTSGSRSFVWDSEIRGFGLVVAPSGLKSYFVRYRPRGAGRTAPKRFHTIGRHGVLTPEQARVSARAILAQVAAGEDPAWDRVQEAKAITVAELAKLFIDEHARAKRKPRTAEGYECLFRRHVNPQLGKRPAGRVSTNELAKLHLALSHTPAQANRLLAVVASMYTFAAKRGLVPKGTNPAAGIEKYREMHRERYLKADELKKLGRALHLAETNGLPWVLGESAHSKHLVKEVNQKTVFEPAVVLAFRLLIFTGARLREILDLKWENVDTERGLLLLPDSKTGRKTIVLSRSALQLLTDAKKSGRYVVSSSVADQPRTDLKRPWSALQKYCGLQDVRLHDLRHTFASVGVGTSLGLPIVGKLLGHSQPATTARYAHLDANPLRRATDAISDILSAAMQVDLRKGQSNDAG